jgi:hypothetical protein
MFTACWLQFNVTPKQAAPKEETSNVAGPQPRNCQLFSWSFTWGIRWMLRPSWGWPWAPRSRGTPPSTSRWPRGQIISYWHEGRHRRLPIAALLLLLLLLLRWGLRVGLLRLWGRPGSGAQRGACSPITHAQRYCGITCTHATQDSYDNQAIPCRAQADCSNQQVKLKKYTENKKHQQIKMKTIKSK